MEHGFERGFRASLFLIEGEASLNGGRLTTADAAGITDEKRPAMEVRQPSKLLMGRRRHAI